MKTSRGQIVIPLIILLVIEFPAVDYDRAYEPDDESLVHRGEHRNPDRNLARDTPLAQTSAHGARIFVVALIDTFG